MIRHLFAAHGRFCAQRPWEVILATVAVTISIMSMSIFTSVNRVCGVSRPLDLSQTKSGMDGVVLVLLKCLALIYIYLQFSKLRKLGSKYLLGIAGLFTVFSSFVFSTVVVDLIGNNLTGLNEALPFFLLLIDLSRASALARFAMSSKSKAEVEENISRAMAELGPAITLDCIVESLVTGVGSLSGVPQLQTMCCFGCLSILANYCAFMTFYPACLALVLEISHGRSEDEPVWKLKNPVKQCPVEELKPNPVTQRVKLIMSIGLLLVHVHRRFVAEKPSILDDFSSDKEYELTPEFRTSENGGLRDDITVWEVFWQRAWSLRLDTLVTLLLAATLVVKYTFYDTDSEEETRPDQADKCSGHETGEDEVDGDMPIGYAKSESAISSSNKNALFTIGDSDDDDDDRSQSQVETESRATQTTDDDVDPAVALNGFNDDVNVNGSGGTTNGDGGATVRTAHRKATRSVDECVSVLKSGEDLSELSDEEVILLVKNKHIPAYKLESILAHHERGVAIRRKLISEELVDKTSLHHMPYRHYDYKYVEGACCENVIGYVPVPVGVAGPLLLDGKKYYVPMATTEGCLVASTNRGCRALGAGDGVSSTVVGDGMTRAPVVRLPSARMASQVKEWLEVPDNFLVIKRTFDSTSRFARLSRLKLTQTGRLLYVRFVSVTGDAMGMNMLSKGSEKAMNKLHELFPELEVLSLSGNFCTDKKPSAINWIEGRGKSVVCEATIPGHVVKTVLKTSVAALVDLNVNKNLIGSAMAGSIGGFNAHAANVVTAMFIACGQDAAQNVASSQCMTLMESSGEQGEDLYITCTMPCIEVGTVGGGTVLPPQSACLQMLGCQGSSQTEPGSNARQLARLICATVLAGELSLMSALAAGHLVRSHLRHNRSMSSISPLPSHESNNGTTTLSVGLQPTDASQPTSPSCQQQQQQQQDRHDNGGDCSSSTSLSPGGACQERGRCGDSDQDRCSPPNIVTFPVNESGLCQPVVRRAESESSLGTSCVHKASS